MTINVFKSFNNSTSRIYTKRSNPKIKRLLAERCVVVKWIISISRNSMQL